MQFSIPATRVTQAVVFACNRQSIGITLEGTSEFSCVAIAWRRGFQLHMMRANKAGHPVNCSGWHHQPRDGWTRVLIRDDVCKFGF